MTSFTGAWAAAAVAPSTTASNAPSTASTPVVRCRLIAHPPLRDPGAQPGTCWLPRLPPGNRVACGWQHKRRDGVRVGPHRPDRWPRAALLHPPVPQRPAACSTSCSAATRSGSPVSGMYRRPDQGAACVRLWRGLRGPGWAASPKVGRGHRTSQAVGSCRRGCGHARRCDRDAEQAIQGWVGCRKSVERPNWDRLAPGRRVAGGRPWLISPDRSSYPARTEF
jgi:hypothetical protein